ncbi:hypothetical protein BBF96_08010 [Anoxybacter fermentans]|uniref:UvrD-like helicase ATP-binding domain-containing protein n=1 Tax=Anoxybacter fermentans TaxID=1323375 RepID=A0A3Q9HQL6_9FIRM|nr:UvrD-helicase domain-containing protein [Anoxybacter fermentans]AZR73331.1 hypothetical protein BBF96_08010 [Anoxybacter fermentans]
MEILYIGPTGSGKTTRLLEKYKEICEKTGQTEHCLVLLKNAPSVSDWRLKVNLKSMGPLNVFTYFGFIQKEITKYWTLIEEKLDDDIKTLEPTFMTVETSHYLMSQMVDEVRIQEGAFASINATSQQIAVQLIDNLNHAAMNGLSFKEVQNRLLRWAAGDVEKAAVYQQAVRVMKRFRKQCLISRCLDYSLIIDLYNQYLLSDDNYSKDLTSRFRYLIVDNLEKTIPRAQDLILKIMQKAEESYLSFNPEGGYTGFFGSNPKLAEKTFFPMCEKVHLKESYTASKESRELAKSIVEKVFHGKPMPQNNFIKGEIHTDLRGDMLFEVGKKVLDLIEKGVQPAKIALIAPLVDKVLEFTLSRYFEERGYSLANLTRTKRLLDEPFAQALITLTFLVNPDWKIKLNFTSLVQTLTLILKLDPIRSALLAEEIFKNQMDLPDLDEIGLRPRLGFDNSDKYELFREWVKEKQTEELEMEHFFQIVFGELLAPLSPDEKDILACRQIINSMTKFKRVMKRFSNMDEKQLSQSFIEMVLKGTLAAEVLFKPPASDEQIILATPYTFLFSPYIDNVQYLFWLDVASENWFRSTTKELTNPYILSRDWEEEDEWTDEVDQTLRKEQLINYVQSLLSKCTDGLYLANSYLNSHGWEQEGELLEWLQSDYPEVMQND